MKIAIQRLQEDADMLHVPLSESDCLVYTCLQHEGNVLLMGRQSVWTIYISSGQEYCLMPIAGRTGLLCSQSWGGKGRELVGRW